MINYDNIPLELRKLNQWVCVLEDSKVPMTATENSPASSVNSSTWSSFEKALSSVKSGYYDYLGFVFNDNRVVGIDIDCGYDDGFLSVISADIIGKCKSYTEKSRSGRGFHILLRGDLPFPGRNNMRGVEIYKSRRYFIMTGNTLLFDKIVENQEAIDYVVDKYFSDIRDRKDNHNNLGKIYQPMWAEPVVGNRLKLRPYYPQIHQGGRNVSLLSVAGSLYNVGYSKRQLYDELEYVNKVACSPPLDSREIMAICNSICKYERK